MDGIALGHDFDGNMLSDGSGMTLTYNGENRLIHAERQGAFAAAYTYDYLGRRVKKAVDSDDDGVVDYEVFYVFDGWNVIREVRKDAGVVTDTKRYVWGLDLSGSMQGAGGIGGLLAVVDGDEKVFTFDGNGNVSEVLAAADGAEQAHYEYDAFGNVVVASGPGAEGNAWRFSTKPVDEEAGLAVYTFRYYSALLGRWTARDPIGGRGGLNLYGMLRNAPIASVDPFGLKLRLVGSTSDVEILKRYLEQTVNTTLEVTSSGIVNKTHAEGGSYSVYNENLATEGHLASFSLVRSWLNRIVCDSKTIRVRFLDDAAYPEDEFSWSSAFLPSGVVRLSSSLRERSYSGTYVPYGGAGSARFSGASILAHELYGHGLAWMKGETRYRAAHFGGETAKNQYELSEIVPYENVVHALLGEPLRARYP